MILRTILFITIREENRDAKSYITDFRIIYTKNLERYLRMGRGGEFFSPIEL